MRTLFAKYVHEVMSTDDSIVVITGDLGFNVWNDVRKDYPDNFYNVGSAEQLMIGMAVGMAMEGKMPICYSITPFLLYRPFELIRNYLDHDKIPVKLVGCGRGRNYKTLGFSHWAEEDMKIMSVLKYIKLYRPEDDLDKDSLINEFNDFIFSNQPSYLSLKK